MRFTDYGKARARSEERFDPGSESGATAHMRAAAHDTGEVYVLTGRDINGRPIRRSARSIEGAYFTMSAVWGINNAWHVTEEGRRLCIRR